MKLTLVPEPGHDPPRLIPVIKALRYACGINLKDAKAITDRVRAGDAQTLHVVNGTVRELLNELTSLGCSVNIAEDLDPSPRPPSREQVAEVNEDMLFADGLDAALVGYVERYGQPPLAVYDKAKVLDILMRDVECDCEPTCDPPCEQAWVEAQEHFDFNIIGAWMGENTPAFLTFVQPE